MSTGAELEHKAGALAGQASHAGRLRDQLSVQYAAQRRAGLAISRLLLGEYFSSSISAAQAQAGLASVLSKPANSIFEQADAAQILPRRLAGRCLFHMCRAACVSLPSR